MRPELILKSFEATGVWPMDAEVILKRFNTTTSGQDEDIELRELGDGDTWSDIRKILDAAVVDKAKTESKQLASTLHWLQVQNELLHHNEGLRAALTSKRKHKKNSKLLDLQQRKKYHGGAVLWSPRKIREARARETVRQREEEQEKLQKTHDGELKTAARLHEKKIAEEAKALRQTARERAAEERKARAAELAPRALKKQQRDAATSQKSRDTPNKGKRKASQSAAPNSTKKRRVVGAESGVDVPSPLPQPPPKTTRGRQIKVPQKFKWYESCAKFYIVLHHKIPR
jgi:hypothetical protein